MAKIIFISSEIGLEGNLTQLFNYNLIQELAQHHHQIQIFGEYRSQKFVPPQHSQIQVMQPIEKFGYFDLIKILPLIYQFRPDFIHLLPPYNYRFLNALILLRRVIQQAVVIPLPKLAISIYDFEAPETQKLIHSKSLEDLDLITVTNSHDMHELKKRNPLYPVCELVPELHLQSLMGAESPFLMNLFDKLIYIPGSVADLSDMNKFIQKVLKAVETNKNITYALSCGWGNTNKMMRSLWQKKIQLYGLSSNIFIPQGLSHSEQSKLLEKAIEVDLSPLKQLRLRAIYDFHCSRKTKKPITLSEQQKDYFVDLDIKDTATNNLSRYYETQYVS